MIAVSTDASPIGRDNAGLEELRGSALRHVLIVIVTLGWAMTFITVRSDWLASWLPVLALLLSAFVSYGLVGRHYRLAAWLMIVGVEVALLFVTRLYPSIGAAYIFPLVVFVAGEFLEAPATLLVTGFSCIYLLVVLPGTLGRWQHQCPAPAGPAVHRLRYCLLDVDPPAVYRTRVGVDQLRPSRSGQRSPARPGRRAQPSARGPGGRVRAARGGKSGTGTSPGGRRRSPTAQIGVRRDDQPRASDAAESDHRLQRNSW